MKTHGQSHETVSQREHRLRRLALRLGWALGKSLTVDYSESHAIYGLAKTNEWITRQQVSYTCTLDDIESFLMDDTTRKDQL